MANTHLQWPKRFGLEFEKWIVGIYLGWGACHLALHLLAPKIAVPTLTNVAPSSMATSKSFDIPMESS